MMKVSVVILNWNGCDMLRTFLPSVVRYSEGEGVEVCVADNGSTDTSVSLLQQEFPSVRTIVLDQNYGFADGYNWALQQVDAEYVVLLNSDVEVTEHWLEPMIAYLDAHPEVAACQPKIRSQRQKEYFEYAGAAGGFIDKYGYPFCRGRIMGVVEKDEGQYDTVIPVFWATGAALLYKNLPQKELNKVMRIRACLDYVAAFNFLLQGHWDNARAVIRARKEYKQLCPSFSLSREENMRKKTLNPIPERTKSSILWQFYARGCKRFSQLSDFKRIANGIKG